MQQFGQKKVLAAEVEPGDILFRSTKTGGDLMMDVQAVARTRRDDQEVFVYSGLTYALDESVVGGQLSGSELGGDSWTIPISGRIYKRVLLSEADFD